jgi:glycosyltransferase involved in cell wall biosynthesis
MPRAGPPVSKVGVATTDWSGSVTDGRGWPVLGGAGWARLGQWARHSRNHVVLGQLATNGATLGVRLADQHLHVDVPTVILQRYMDRRTTELIQRAQRNGQRVINDLDDWFWGIHERNAAARHIDPAVNPESNIDHYRRTLEASDLVTVSTSFLAEQISEWGVPVQVIENRVSPFMYSVRRHRDGIPVVGWVGSTAHRSGDLDVVKRALAKVARTVTFHHTGDHPAHPSFCDELGLDTNHVTTLPMLSPYEYPHGFVFDIGLVPLVDIPFNHAKSAIKGLEYAAAGVPFIASPLPEYLRLRDQFGVGRIAANTAEWVAHIEELADPELRAAEAHRQYEIVSAEFHVKDMAREFDAVVIR